MGSNPGYLLKSFQLYYSSLEDLVFQQYIGELENFRAMIWDVIGGKICRKSKLRAYKSAKLEVLDFILVW